jgi:hypothetical protein
MPISLAPDAALMTPFAVRWATAALSYDITLKGDRSTIQEFAWSSPVWIKAADICHIVSATPTGRVRAK